MPQVNTCRVKQRDLRLLSIGISCNIKGCSQTSWVNTLNVLASEPILKLFYLATTCLFGQVELWLFCIKAISDFILSFDQNSFLSHNPMFSHKFLISSEVRMSEKYVKNLQIQQLKLSITGDTAKYLDYTLSRGLYTLPMRLDNPLLPLHTFCVMDGRSQR